MLKPSQKGFTLFELLVVMCIIICLCVLLFPKISPVLLKKKHMEAVNHCKAVCSGFAYYTKLHGGTFDADNPFDLTLYPAPALTAVDVEQFLVPDFLFRVPEIDPWGNAYEYYFDRNNIFTGENTFACRSLGRNGIAEDGAFPLTAGPFPGNIEDTDPGFVTDDIICADGEIVSWPGDYVDTP